MTRAFDADGHIGEDIAAIRRHMPSTLLGPEGSLSPFDRFIFPSPMVHHSCQPIRLPKTFGVGSVDEWIDFLEFMPLEGAALYPTFGLPFGYILNPAWAIAVSRAYNDWLYETYLVRDKRFVGMGILPLLEPSAAAEELDRCVTELGMAGAVLPATGLSEPLGSTRYEPLHLQANRLSCALAVHGGIHLGLGMDRLPVFATVNALGHPVGQVIQFASIASGGLFDRYPDVRFAFLEAGAAWLEMALERFDRGWETQSQLDPEGRFWQIGENEKVSDYLARHARAGRWFYGLEGDERAVATITSALGVNPAMFSSDFPHEVTMDRCKEELREIDARADIDDTAKEAMTWRNAAALYGRQVV
jgi:predicted TIM-barrel fold metal-dependent hydrolase